MAWVYSSDHSEVVRRIILFLVIALFLSRPFLFSQPSPDSIDATGIENTIRFLAADSLKGRGNKRPELLEAGKFIGGRFERAGLLTFPGMPSHYLPFYPFGLKKNIVSDELKWNGQPVHGSHFIYLNPQPGHYTERRLSDFAVIKLDTCFDDGVIQRLHDNSKPLLIWTDRLQPDGKTIFPESFLMPERGIKNEVLLVHTNTPPDSLVLSPNPSYYDATEYNVVGLLPGRTKPKEVIVFTAHYDHNGVEGKGKDSIMNGANDNASGTTAMLALAEYFAQRGDNDRTLMFCAFAGEELGLKGSFAFMNHVAADKIAAVVNIEMIGVPQYGKNKVFITGEGYSSLYSILRKQLTAAGLKVIKEPREEKMLFRRSDNYPFALKGVPAHTIMSSDDDDKCYHRPCDDLERIDMKHLATVIRAIAKAVQPLVSGAEIPTRIDPDDFR